MMMMMRVGGDAYSHTTRKWFFFTKKQTENAIKKVGGCLMIIALNDAILHLYCILFCLFVCGYIHMCFV